MRKLIFIIAVVMVWSVSLFGDVSTAWTKQYGTELYDIAYGVATDSSGDIYVTGDTNGALDGSNQGGGGNSDIFLSKFNAAGIRL